MAEAVLRVFPDESRLLRSKEDAGSVDFERVKRTQRQLVRSPAVLTAALQRDSVASLPTLREQVNSLAWLQQHITVTFPDEAEIMYVGVRGCPDRTTAEAITNAVVEVYLLDVVGAERQEKLLRITSLQKAQTETEADLRKKRIDLRQLSDALGIADSEALTQGQRFALEEYSDLWKQLSEVELELKVLQRKRGAAESRAQPVAKSGTQKDSASVAQLDDSIATHELMQKELSERTGKLRKEVEKFGRSSADVEMMRADIKALTDLLDRLNRELRQSNIEASSMKSSVVVLSAAKATEDDDHRLRLTTTCGLAALLACGAVVVLWNSRRRGERFPRRVAQENISAD
ncbi:MAG TPA: hypothetical protein VGP76_30055 [Planctomycetaceae bacterium]|nr:hypothetical protein [Planctomycetaceae bacterium]